MERRAAQILVLLGALCCLAASGFTAPRRIAVLDFRNPAGLTAQEVQDLSTVVRGAALSLDANAYLVLTRENIFQMLPPGADYATCTEAKCEVEFGRLVGADLVVSGDIVRFGRALKMTVVLHDTKTAALLATEPASASTVEALETPARAAAERVFTSIAGRRPPSPGRVFGGDLELEPVPEVDVDVLTGPEARIGGLATLDIALLKKISFAKETERRGSATVHEKISAWQVVVEHPGEHPEKEQAAQRIKEWEATIEAVKKRRVQAARLLEQFRIDQKKLVEIKGLPDHTVSPEQKKALSEEFDATYGPYMDDFKILEREEREASGANEFGL